MLDKKETNMTDACKTKKISVYIQKDGLIKNTEGQLIAKLNDEINFDSKHLKEDREYEDLLMRNQYLLATIDLLAEARWWFASNEPGSAVPDKYLNVFNKADGQWKIIGETSDRMIKLEERCRSLLYYIQQRIELSDETSADYSRQVYQTQLLLNIKDNHE